MAMDRNILYKKLEHKLSGIKNADFDVDLTLWLIRKVIFHDPTKNCHIKVSQENWVGLPKSKSLFFAKKDKGFPIGNLTSQLFGNIYLDELDHFIHEKFGSPLTGYGIKADTVYASPSWRIEHPANMVEAAHREMLRIQAILGIFHRNLCEPKLRGNSRKVILSAFR